MLSFDAHRLNTVLCTLLVLVLTFTFVVPLRTKTFNGGFYCDTTPSSRRLHLVLGQAKDFNQDPSVDDPGLVFCRRKEGPIIHKLYL